MARWSLIGRWRVSRGWWVLAVAGCAARGPGRGVSEVDLLLAEADRAWDNRGPGGWAAIEAPLARIRSRQPAQAEAAWRWVRLGWARSWARDEPEDATWDLAQARGDGLACLDVASGFLQQRGKGDWAAAAAQVPELRQPCLGWTALAWATWVSRSGPAAVQHDQEPVLALAAALEADPDPAVAAFGSWSRLLLLPPATPEDLQTARALRERVPSAILLEADLVRMGAEPDTDWLDRQTAAGPEERKALSAARGTHDEGGD